MASGSKVTVELGIIDRLKDKFETSISEGEYIPLGDVDNFFRVHEVNVPSVNYLIAAVISLRDLMKLREADNNSDCDDDMVNRPPHYNVHAMECFDEMLTIFGPRDVFAYCVMNAWKYRYRADAKGNPEQDNAKTDWYIAKAKELNDAYSLGMSVGFR